MNTQLAINLLTENSNNLSNTLAALGLLSNGETISSLQLKVEQIIKTTFEKHQQLSSKVDTLEGNLGQTENEFSLALSNQSIEQARLAELQKQQNELEITIQSLEDRKQVLSGNGDSKKAAIKAEIEVIKANIITDEAEATAVKQQISDGLALVASYDSFIQQAQVAQEQANYYNQYVQKWQKVGEKRLWKIFRDDDYDWVTDEEQVNLRDSFQTQANQFNQQAASIQGAVDSFKQSLPGLEGTKNSKTDQIWLYYQELDAKNNVLSFTSTQSGNDLALLDLQLSQSQTDLMQLKDIDIPSQKLLVDSTTQRVTQVQSELDQFKTQKVSAQQDLDTFVENNKELLTTDLSLNLLQDSIAKSQSKISSLQDNLAQPDQSTDILNGLTQALALEQGKLEQLKHQYQLLALEALDVNQGRLESLNGQLAAETSVSSAVQVNTIEGYVDLVPQFVQQLTGLSDVWAENLKDNHQFTVEVSNLFQSNLTSFEGLAGYIEDNLADPYSDYVLNGIQLDEAIAIQDAQVKYRDALAKTVDDLGENIELQKKAVEQVTALGEKVEHISKLKQYEKEYSYLVSVANNLSQLNIFALNLADGSWSLLDDFLAKYGFYSYIQQRYNSVIDLKNQQLSSSEYQNAHPDTDNTFNYIHNSEGLTAPFWEGNAQIQVADFNGDGKDDIANLQSDGNNWIAISNGNGTFNYIYNPQGLTAPFWEGNAQIQVADFNGDGKDDIANLQSDGNNWIAISNGNGTFNYIYNPQGLTAPFWEGNSQIQVADFNGDGKDDIANLQSDGNNWIAISNGNGTFNYIYNPQGLTAPFWEGNSQIQVADFNGDGKDDIANLQSDGNNWIAISNGNGTFNYIYNPQGLTAPFWEGNSQIQVADFNGDGKDDIANLQSDGNNWIAISNGNGTFNYIYNPQGLTAPFWEGNAQIQVADFNGDGKDDIANLQSDGNNWIAISNGNGTFNYIYNPQGLTAPFWEGNAQIQVADFNGDGKDDIANLQSDGNNWIAISNGNGTFNYIYNPQGLTAPFWEGNSQIQVADFNGDGKNDIANLQSDGNNWIAISRGDSKVTIKKRVDQEALDSLKAIVEKSNNEIQPLINQSLESISPLLINYLSKEITDNIQSLAVQIDLPNEQQEQWIETTLQKYIQQKESNITTSLNGSNEIDALQNLRLEIAHLTLQTEKNPDEIQQFLQEYEAGDKTAPTLQNLRDRYYPELNQATTLDNLQTQINKEITQSQEQIEGLKADITQKQAQSAAALSQADWYEQQAAIHWELSHKGKEAIWTEQRSYTETTWYGKKKTKWTTVTHVDHDWIISDNYTKQAKILQEKSKELLKGITTDTTNQNTATDILTQWQAASAVADQTALSQADLIALLNQLDADRQLNGDKKQQIADWETLLPTLQSQLQQAIQDAEIAKNNLTQEWTEYETSQDDYQTALTDVLTRRAELQSQGQILLQEINNVDEWVNQQNTLLSDEITQVATLITQLQTQRDNIPDLENDAQTITTLQVLLDESIQLLTQKQIVLSAEQSTFTQKQTLLETQKKVIETQYELLDTYLDNPDKDTSNLEKLLTDTRVTLAEVQKLAEQAEASSNALAVLMDDVQVSLLLQNDKYLSAIKDKQKTLQDLLQATELKENDTLKATQKQLELNDLQTKLLDILKQANDAGSQEAAKLLEVASYSDFASVAELYHRDYQDLASDQGGSCAGGIARPEDIQLANYYYSEMLKYQQLQTEAQWQVDQFTQLGTLAKSQAAAIQQQQTLATQELALLQQSIGNSQEQIDANQEELAIAQFRIDALLQLRNWTEQTQVQLLSVEQLNLAQAKLEQEIATNREYLIDDTVKGQLDKQRLDIERDRQIAVVKLEELNQLKTEEALQTAINNLRFDLGVNPIEELIQLADYKGQLAGILADIEALKQKQPSLPETTKTLLDNTLQDIHTALQGKEALIVQENLLKTANALIEQSNTLKAEIAQLQHEEQRYLDLLTQSETDLQGATKALYDEIQKSGVLDSEKTLLNAQNIEILYKIGYAEGAVDLSSELAKQSKEILEQVIAGRIEERKAREKAAFNENFGTITLVISAVAAVLTAGASLAVNAATAGLSGAAATAAAANATILGVSASTISTIATTLKTISATISIAQAAYNGDWSTVIFKVGLSFADGLKDIAGLSSDTVNTLKTSLNTAYTAYKGGDSIGTLLGAIQGIGAIAADGVDLSDLSQVSNLKAFLITTSQISTVVHTGIQAIEDGDILKGIQALGQSLGTISKNFGLGLEETAKAELEDLTGLEWQKLDQIIDVGGNAYNAIKNENWIDLVKVIGGTVKIVDEDFAGETENQGKTALKNLTGLEWSEFEQIVDASQTLRVAIKAKNINDISAALNNLANVWVSDEKLNSSLVEAIGLNWEDLTYIAKTVDILIPAIRNDNTEAWVKATGDFLTTWESNAAFQKHLKDTTHLEWTEFKQLVAIGQTVAVAVDQRSINAWVDALKTTLDWALKDTSFDNQKVKQIITTAEQTNNTDSWVAAVDQLLGVAEDATALRNKLGGITGVTWDDFKQIINAGQAIATAIDKDNFTSWRDALKTTLNIWVDDATLQQNIETTTGFKWEQLTRIGSTSEALRQADKGGDATSWLKAADQILTLWEKDTTLQNQVKTLTNLDWQELKDLVAIGKTIDTAIDQKTYDTWRDALKQTVNFWVTDQTLNQSLESLIGLNWNQLDKIGQAGDALYKAYGKADTIIDKALDSNHYQDWLNGIKDVYQLWKDDPILRQKATDAGKVIWSEVEDIFKAEGTLDTKNRLDTIQNNIQDTISTIETTLPQKLESTIGLSWTQVKAVAKSGQIIAKAIADNKTEQWIQASDQILSIWEQDSELRQVLKDKYNIDWTNIKASVSSGQNLAKAVEANTVPAWGTALQNIINIWAGTTTLTPQQQEKLQQTNTLVNQVKASDNSQEWLAVTNQVIDLWKDETAFQTQLQQNNQLSWQDISKSVQSGQVLALDQNGLEQWLGNLKNVVEIWKSDPEIKTIVENVSDFNWQSLSNIINDNSLNFINGDDNNNNLIGTAKNDYIYAKDGNDYLDGGSGGDILYGGMGADILIGGTGNDNLYLGANDSAVDIVNYAFGDGADILYQFVRGVGGDQIQFTGIANIDVMTSGTDTLLRLGNGTTNNAGFGTGKLLVTLSGTSSFSSADVNVNLFGTNFLFS